MALIAGKLNSQPGREPSNWFWARDRNLRFNHLVMASIRGPEKLFELKSTTSNDLQPAKVNVTVKGISPENQLCDKSRRRSPDLSVTSAILLGRGPDNSLKLKSSRTSLSENTSAGCSKIAHWLQNKAKYPKSDLKQD
ncbi:hypothetical protein V2J09_023657 [Rumex salicifolius]